MLRLSALLAGFLALCVFPSLPGVTPARGAEAGPYQIDPLCLPGQRPLPPLAPGNPAPSTRRMAARLAALVSDPRLQTLPFRSDRLAELFAAQLESATNPMTRVRLSLQVALQEAQRGRPDVALNAYADLEKFIQDSNGSLSPGGRAEFQMRRAIAFLRLGEQENCLARYVPESCLFPISSNATHVLPRGSRAAIEVLEEHLQQYPQNLGARWLLNVASMTLGRYPDGVPPRWRIPPSAFASEHPMPRFHNVAAAAGLDREDVAGGVIADDFDNDGHLDLLISAWTLDGQLRFYRNQGDGRFVERTSEAGLVGLTGGLNLVQADYNNDGHLDALILRGAWLGAAGRFPKSLLRNNGDGTFTDVTEEAGLLTLHPSQTAAWLDFDGDGWLDVFVGNETPDPSQPDPCELFRNNRDGTFTECAAAVGVQVTRFVKGVAAGDYDNDGRPDLYLSCRSSENILLHNDGPVAGGWRFSDVSQRAGVVEPVFSFPTWFFDYDNDGWEDLFVSGYRIGHVGDIVAEYMGLPSEAEKPRLYRNNRDGTFADVTASSRLLRVCHTMGSNYGDLDNDGWLDFYLGTGDPDLATLVPNRMFRNDGGRRFQDVTTATGTGHLQKGHGVAFADLDNDGDQDVYVVMGGAFPGDTSRKALFQNPGNAHRSVRLQLVGTRSNRSAIGARAAVEIEGPTGRRVLHRTVGPGSSFGGNPLRLEIGIGDATRIVGVEVRWPGSGLRERFDSIEPGKAHVLREGSGRAP